MNLMQRLVSRQRVLVLAITVGCIMAIVTTVSNFIVLDAAIYRKAIVMDLVRALALGSFVTYFLGLKVMQVNLLSRRLEIMASYDFLTAALSRAKFFAEIEEKNHLCGAFLIFDMNDFKLINDTLGHAAGDEALVKVADAARRALGPEDYLCRLGGDEFLAFFSNLDKQHIHDRARTIAFDIMEQFVGEGEAAIKLSASFGLSVLNFGDNIDEAIAKADEDLYRAKSIHRRNKSAAELRSKSSTRLSI